LPICRSSAEGRGKAQADSLRKSRTQTKARKLVHNKEELVLANDLRKGMVVICDAARLSLQTEM